MFQSFQDKVSKGIQTFGKIPFLFGLIGIEIFVFVNGASVFPQWDTGYQSVILAYLVMTCAFGLFIFIKSRQMARTREELGVHLSTGSFSFAVGFFVTIILMAILVKAQVVVVDTSFPKSIYFETVLIQICVVATSEELMFRGVFLDIFGSRKWTGIITTSILFAVWHSYAYQIVWYQFDWSTFNIGAVIIAFVFSVILSLISRNPASEQKVGGLPATIGIHGAWNLCIIGAIPITGGLTSINIYPLMMLMLIISGLILIPILIKKKRKTT